ncbi:hypothetical protein P153DRAFT_361506 [Dothidotthia symphoricarpi CBS 119687]|uniref:Uncharacterized protein n=1 Tax=Dothidotthia symphoricarpi CBS 119687 TaxID=1392245 RepID=A0A6A5ZX33_9PLEO|nr:uncharacterized protein P153DRAFT_361506 [Dothidotthia symphoricarpi CBS 119687]KAF2123856.1 hypothetical protein P153DRAFT_361506 [Dothidotthia symphoricarpi CBS 119687]
MSAKTDTPPTPRLAYIRTILEPDETRESIDSSLKMFVRQESSELSNNRPKHHFLFGASNTSDSHILDIFLSNIPTNHIYYAFRYLQKLDLELRISYARAATGTGKNILQHCINGDIRVLISGKDDEECDEIMLQECDYIIDSRTTYLAAWFWNSARPGVPQDSMLTNPDYNVNQHDVSSTRLRNRYNAYAWRPSSGGFHGNFRDWRCRKCDGKCKRGRCCPKEAPKNGLV